MYLHHQLLAAAYRPIKMVKAMGQSMGFVRENQLRVLLYHDIAPGDQGNFAAQMRWLKSSWNFISVQRFEAMMTGQEPILGRNVLLTFDDGFASNRQVVEQVLNPMGIQALFFVVSELADITDDLQARNLIAASVCPGKLAKDLPSHWRSMGWNDLEALLDYGHVVGCHTGTHARLSEVHSLTGLEKEIVSSANSIEERLRSPVDHFSFTFGDLASFSDAAFSVARKQFRFIHSGLRGDNSMGVSPLAIRRDSAARQDSDFNYSVFSNNLLGAFLEGAADARYAKSRVRLDAWAAH